MTGAGDLDRRITLQSVTLTNDPVSNEQIESWTTYATVWAHLVEQGYRASERLAAQRWTAESIRTFRIRYRDDVEPTHRLLFDGDAYEVEGQPVEVEGRHKFLDIAARLTE